MNKPKENMLKKSCLTCADLGYIKDDRSRSIVCRFGENYNYRDCQYHDIADKCRCFNPVTIKGSGQFIGGAVHTDLARGKQ